MVIALNQKTRSHFFSRWIFFLQKTSLYSIAFFLEFMLLFSPITSLASSFRADLSPSTQKRLDLINFDQISSSLESQLHSNSTEGQEMTLNSPLSVGGQFFSRYEVTKNTQDFSDNQSDSSNQFEFQFRPHFQWLASSEVRLVFEPELSSRFGSEQVPSRDPNLGLNQGFLDYQLDPVSFRLGRQSLDFGQGLILSRNEWGVAGNAFDGLRISLKHGIGWSDFFWMKINETSSDSIAGSGDDDLYGYYLSIKLDTNIESLDAYALHFSNQAGSPVENASTFGIRLSSVEWNQLSSSTEFSLQNSRASIQNLLNFSFFAHLRLPMISKLRFSVTRASSNFQSLYPEFHEFLGRGDAFGFRNITAVSFDLFLNLTPQWTLLTGYSLFRRTSSSTPAFQVDGITDYGVQSTEDSIAQELDFVLLGHLNKALSLEVTGALIFAGPYLKANQGSDLASAAWIRVISQF